MGQYILDLGMRWSTLKMGTDVLQPRYVMHTPGLPCHRCGILTTTSRVESGNDKRWILIPLCARHQAAEKDGGSS
jgi:hypothetical protein